MGVFIASSTPNIMTSFFTAPQYVKFYFRFREEVRAIGISDLEALSAWLGNKPYMMGSAPCPLDSTVFGFLALFFYAFPEDYYFRVEAEKRFPNLKAYAERIKNTYWPDWDEILNKNG